MKRWQLILPLFTAGLALTIALLGLMDVPLTFGLYSYLTDHVHSISHLPYLLIGVIILWLATVPLVYLLSFLFSVLLRKRAAVALMILLLLGCVVTVYFFSQPRAGNYFSVLTGGPRYKYGVLPDSKIELFPLSYNFEPRYGAELEKLTPDVARAYDEQRKILSDSSIKQPESDDSHSNNQQLSAHTEGRLSTEKWPEINCEPKSTTIGSMYASGDHLIVWVEYVAIKDNRTQIGLVCTPPEGHYGVLPLSPNGTYIADSNGRVYDFSAQSVEYDEKNNMRTVRRHEVYRFYLLFPELEFETPYIYLHDRRITPTKINLDWHK